MPRSPVLSLMIAALIGLLAAPVVSPAPARAQDGAALFQGRWRGTDLTPAFREFGLDRIEIAPCGANLCGFVPTDDGSCGPIVMQFFLTQQGHLEGEMNPARRPARVQARREGDGIVLGVFDGTKPFTLRKWIVGSFVRDGSASCR